MTALSAYLQLFVSAANTVTPVVRRTTSAANNDLPRCLIKLASPMMRPTMFRALSRAGGSISFSAEIMDAAFP